jgi:hypothetical protein
MSEELESAHALAVQNVFGGQPARCRTESAYFRAQGGRARDGFDTLDPKEAKALLDELSS